MNYSSLFFFFEACFGFFFCSPFGRFFCLLTSSGGLRTLLPLGAGLLLPCTISIPPIASTAIAAPAIAIIGSPPSSSTIQEDWPSSGWDSPEGQAVCWKEPADSTK